MPLSLKIFFPASFYGRAVLILIMPILVIQIVLSVVFIQRHYERVTAQMTTNILRDIRFLSNRIEASDQPEEVLAELSDLIALLNIDIHLAASGPEIDRPRVDRLDIAGHEILRVLDEDMARFHMADLVTDRRQVQLWLVSRHGFLELQLPRRLVTTSNPHQLLVIVFLASILMTLIAFQFLRLQVRPIRRLGAAAEAYGRGESMPFRATGAREVRAAGQAFLDMRHRLERQREQQRIMLSGVSHDMRTPLTRMRLILSMMDESEDRTTLEAEIADLEARLDGFLDYTRGQIAEPLAEVDLAALVSELVDRYRTTGHPVTLFPSPGLPGTLAAQPGQITRALDNLISNALRHGNKVTVQIARTSRGTAIAVEDDGPGIAPEDRARATEPFTRLDAARGSGSGGVGLGLAIADEVMRSHGGSLRLEGSDALGGLRAVLRLPRRSGKESR